MKKLYYLFLFLLLLIPKVVYGETIEKFYINAYIQTDGSFLVKELIQLNGNYNGTERILKYAGKNNNNELYYGNDKYNGTGIKNIKVASIPINKLSDSFPREYFVEEYYTVTNDSSTNHQVKKYYMNEIENGVHLKIFNSSKNKSAFYIEYEIENVVINYQDVSEILWSFIDSEQKELIEDVQISVYLPRESSELRVFSHGPVNGENSIINKGQVEAKWDYLNAQTPIDIRVVFDNDLVISQKKENTEALSGILQYEQKTADKQNDIRKQAKIYYYGMIVLTVFWLVGLVTLVYRFIIKHDKEYKPVFNNKYLRDFPSDIGPELVGYIFNQSKLSSNHMTASILNLIYKKSLKLDPASNEKTYTILDVDPTNNNLSSSELKLKTWLLNSIGDGTKFTNKELQEKSKNDYVEFNLNYSLWIDDVIAEGNKLNIFEDKSSSKIGVILYCVSIIVLIMINYALGIGAVLPCICIVPAAISIIKIANATKRTKEGNEEYVKWKALKNFMIDFGRMDEKELPEIYLWDKYLVYATVFGIAKQVEKNMKIKISNMNVEENTLNDMIFFNNGLSIGFSNSIGSSINTSVSRAISSASAAKTITSSGSGFGGGASFGGGGGGGGGSIGRF